MTTFTSSFGADIDRFLVRKRALGFTYEREEAWLSDFDGFASARNSEHVTESLIREYLADGSAGSRPHRLSVVRQLARFLFAEEPSTFVPPSRFLGIRRRRPAIRVFSRAEASRFLDACDAFTQQRPFTQRSIHGIALRVLLMTGLRRGELLALKEQNVDLGAGVLSVVEGKYRKSRFVPMASDLTDRLEAYRSRLASALGTRRKNDAFFPRSDGHRATAYKSLYKSFRRTLHCAGIEHRGRGEGPRLHDLRHSFAVLRLLSWYEQGADLRAQLPLLSTYLGHVDVTTSQVYFHTTQDFMDEVTRRQLEHFGDLITAEVVQ